MPIDHPAAIAIITAAFLIAGFTKGVIGLGQQAVALAFLVATIGLTQAMALIIIPSLVTNIWQSFTGGHLAGILRRIWGFLLAAILAIFPGAALLSRADVALLSSLLGVLLVIYALLGLVPIRFKVRRDREPWIGPLAGGLNGLLTGMTGSFVVPGVMYLQAIGLPRDQFIQAMGLLFLASTMALAAALGQANLLTGELAAASALAVIPTLAGAYLGQIVRRRLSEEAFRRVFYASLLLLGIYIVLRYLLR